MKRFGLLFLILIFSLLLSSSNPELQRFDVDHDAHFINIKTHLDSHTFPLKGTTNSFINIGPLEYILYMGVEYFYPEPKFSVYFGVFLYIISIIILFYILDLLIDNKIILYLILMLFSVDPYLIWVSRDSTNISIFLPSISITLYGILYFINKKEEKYIIVSISGLLLSIQSHLIAIIFSIPIIIIIYKSNLKFSFKKFIIPILIFTILYIPWIGNEFKTGFSDILQKIEISSIKTDSNINHRDEILNNIFHQGYHIDSVNSGAVRKIYEKLGFLQYKNTLSFSIFIFSLILLIIFFFLNFKKRNLNFQNNFILLFIFFINSIFITLTAPKFASRYMLIFYPLYFLIIAFAFQQLYDYLKTYKKSWADKLIFIFTIFILLIIFLNVSYLLTWRNYVEKSGIIKNDFSLKIKRKIVKRLIKANNFTPYMIEHNFHNLYTPVSSGYKYLSLIYGKNNHKNLNNIRAYLVKKGEFPDVKDRFSIGKNIELIISNSEFKNRVLLSQNNINFIEDTLPVFIENQGGYTYIKSFIHVDKTHEVNLFIISRAIPDYLYVDNKLKYKIKIKKRKIIRESLPNFYRIDCGVLKEGDHQINIRLFLNDLWSSIEIFDLPE